MLDVAAAVFLGNVLTLSCAWGFLQFHRHDYNAPWMAYWAVILPVLFLAGSVYLTAEPSPLLYALSPR